MMQERDEDTGQFESESDTDERGEMENDEQGSDERRKKGASAKSNPGNFANDPERAREAGRKGGKS